MPGCLGVEYHQLWAYTNKFLAKGQIRKNMYMFETLLDFCKLYNMLYADNLYLCEVKHLLTYQCWLNTRLDG